MFKKSKLIASIGLLLFGSNSFAEFDGLYLGLGAGADRADFKQIAWVIRQSPFVVDSFNVLNPTRLAGQGAFGSVFLGAEKTFCASENGNFILYLGAELNLNAGRVKHKSANREFVHRNFSRTTYKMDRQYGFSLLPGVLLSDCDVLYARIGAVERKFRVVTTDISLENIHRKLHGTRAGLGIKHAFSDCYSLRFDYSLAYYRKAEMFAQDGLVFKHTRVYPRTNTFELSLIYKFF